METSKITTLLLVQQYLKEKGYTKSLKTLVDESGEEYEEHLLETGGQLESMLDTAREILNVQEESESQKEEKKAREELLLSGKGDYVKDLSNTFDSIHKSNILSVSFSPHSPDLIVTGSTDRTIRIFNSTNGNVSSTLGHHNSAILGVEFNPNPSFGHLLLSCAMDGSVFVVDTRDGSTIASFVDHKKYVVTCKWKEDGLMFATGSYDNTVNIYSSSSKDKFENPTLLKTLHFSTNVESLLFHDKFPGMGSVLVICARDDNYLHMLNLEKLQDVRFNMNANLDDHVSFSAMHISICPTNPRYILVGTDRDRMIIYSSTSSTPVRNFYGHHASLYSHPRVAWNLTSGYVYCSSDDFSVYCWEVSTQKVITTLKSHKKTLRDMAHHPTKESLATVSFDQTVKLWTS